MRRYKPEMLECIWASELFRSRTILILNASHLRTISCFPQKRRVDALSKPTLVSDIMSTFKKGTVGLRDLPKDGKGDFA